MIASSSGPASAADYSARSNTSGGNVRASVSLRDPPLDFAALRAAVGTVDVLGLLGFRAQSFHGAQLHGPCPLHGSTSSPTRCFSVNTSDQIFHCFKCGCSGNALELCAPATRLAPDDAALYLCQRLNIPVPKLPSQQRNREEEP